MFTISRRGGFRMKLKTKELTFIALAAALMAVFSQISLPIGSVPMTVQIFAVVLIGTVLDKKSATISMVIFVLLGAIGIPVFANFKSGLSAILGATGGYLYGFIFTAFIVAYLKEFNNKILLYAGTVFSIVLTEFIGTLQLKIVLSLTMVQALTAGFIPFILKDIILGIIAVIVGQLLTNKLRITRVIS